ncbi:hypothetical protein [Rhodococcus sp. NPDC004095]
MKEYVAVLLVPVVTAILGALGIVLRDVYERRSDRGRRKYAIDDATHRISFITDWWNAKQTVGVGSDELQSAQETVQRWLKEAISQVSESMRPTTRPEGQYSVMRRVLLAYPFKRVSAQLLRVLYCIVLYLFLPFWVVVYAFDIPNFDDYTSEEWGGVAVMFAFLMVLALGLRAWAVSIEGRAARRPTSASVRPTGVPGPMGAPQSYPPQSYPQGSVLSPAMGWYGPRDNPSHGGGQ